MDVAELVLKYLDVLAWPSVVGLVVYLFRGRLRELLGRVTEWEGGGFRAQFAELQARTAAESKTEPTADESGEPRRPFLGMKIYALADLIRVPPAWRNYDVVALDVSGLDTTARHYTLLFLMGFDVGVPEMDFEGNVDTTSDIVKLIHKPATV